MAEPTPLFLVGVGRSGTTALADLFAVHPQVVMGMERFKNVWRYEIESLTPELFGRKAFFDFTDGHTNIRPDVDERWAAYYLRQEAKWDRARYVGDKMTIARMGGIWKALPDAKFVFIVRDAAEVAASYDARAKRASDVNWPADRNREQAIRDWNQGNMRIRRARRQHPHQTILVEYASFFGDPEATRLRRVLEWLGLDYGPEVADAFTAAHQVYETRIAGRENAVPPEVRALVAEHAAPGLWRQLRKLAI